MADKNKKHLEKINAISMLIPIYNLIRLNKLEKIYIMLLTQIQTCFLISHLNIYIYWIRYENQEQEHT